jgi:hypothetical protein
VRFLIRFSRKLTAPVSHHFSFLPRHSKSTDARRLLKRILRVSVTQMDHALRVRLRIFEFTQEQGCILRASLTHAKYPVVLPSGERINHGDPILELHFWNERLTSILEGYSLVGRGVRLRFALHDSLVQLATFLATQDGMQNVKALYARFARSAGKSALVRAPFGFQIVSTDRSLAVSIHDILENVLINALCWVFGPPNQQHFVALKRIEMWFPTAEFLDLYRPIDTFASPPTSWTRQVNEPPVLQ